MRHISLRSCALVVPSPFRSAALCLTAAFCAACSSGSGDDDSDAFRVRPTQWAVAGNTKVVISGDNIAFVADELSTGAGGTDLNGDTVPDDGVVVFVDADSGAQLNVGVVAQDFMWIGNELYLVVSEMLDSRDWNLDTLQDDIVLLHWSRAVPMLTFVDELDPLSSKKAVAFGARLVYATADAVTDPNTSTLRTIDATAPVPLRVTTTDAGGALHPSIVAQEAGLVFVAFNEAVEARVLNADSDSSDNFVLGLLDLRTAAAPLRNVGLGLPSATSPIRARHITGADWQVGFLVSESAQGMFLNDPADFSPMWQATQCIGFADTDMNDTILHYLRFAAWVTDPIVNPVRNTGLVGIDKISIANGFIATICPENAAGGTLGEGTCDLNQDGDRLDRVVRWTQMVAGTAAILPPNSALNIHALDDTVGGTRGLAELQERFVIVVDEAADDLDINMDGLMAFDLVGWLVPGNTSTPWQFMHSGSFVGATYVAETRDRQRLSLALPEVVGGISLNDGTSSNPGDNDLLDSVPTFPMFNSSGVMRFPGVGIALNISLPGTVNPGMVIARGLGYYRVSETFDSRDWSDDGDTGDQVTFRSSLSQGLSNLNGISSTINRPVIEFDPESGSPSCAALLTDEQLQGSGGTDINDDGDDMDIVLQFFVF